MKPEMILLNAIWLLVITGAILFAQGDLNPTQLNGALDAANNPQPFMKTLGEVEPRIAVSPLTAPEEGESVFQISRPGSYYLTGDVVGTPGFHGIVIAASNVNLDLNGFCVRGVLETGSGIVSGPDPISNTTIRNGTLSGWSGNGIDLENATGSTEIRDVKATENLGHGFRVNGTLKAFNVTAVNNGGDGIHSIDGSKGGGLIGALAKGNGGIGIKAGGATTIRDCTANNNGGVGITAEEASTISNCAVAFNESGGMAVGPCDVIERVVAASNGQDGIVAGAACTLRDCSANENGGAGITTGEASTLDNCAVTLNQSGGMVVGPCTVIERAAVASNSQFGIRTGKGSVVVESTVGGSPLGIELGDASRLRGCVVNGEQVGIQVGANSRLITITLLAETAGATGLDIQGAGNRVESSHVVASIAGTTGVSAASPDNLFMGLSATGEGAHYSLPDGAAQGPIVTGGELLTNTNPAANISY